MNKLMTIAFVAASMLAGSAFAAQADKTPAPDKTAATDTATTKVKKHHHTKKAKKSVATTPAAAPAK